MLPLHGDLPAAEQDRAVRPSAERKLILSTNVAETSVTIDGVVCVIDSGLARIARHSPWTGLPSLQIEPVSRAIRASPLSITVTTPSIVTDVSATLVARITLGRGAGRTARSWSSAGRSP
ncbi:MAG TPA: helicase-related protein [Kofleriaceae bacterium]|nr:helicase-related protein [Kofleriaceae bacterium]